MSAKKTYFASDIHLGNRYMENAPEAEKKLVRWLDGIKNDAAAIYFLGDVFDYWYEYKYVVPRGHVRFLGKIAELSDAGVEIHLLTGNHDIWMFDYLTAETGAIIHREPFTAELSGKKFFLAHGDEVGRRPLQYRIIQKIFRSRLCQFLYVTIHPRWTSGFARRYSLRSRKNGLAPEKCLKAQEQNLKSLTDFSNEYIQTHPDVDYFIFGHLHIIYNRVLTEKARMLVIGDWLLRFSYAEWNGEVLDIRIYED
ncbi:MAG: UDP-2,3-diacylglucosamine diphosphatase [Tannerella sp.]|jgi:UDP-2,3-diacylglucosamine hydrolase|nr:UDP-2,3-diacylglucosamine diphosphatase [Tannerella sp.]